MHLTQDQLFDFEENGFLVLPELFQPKEVNEINEASREIFSEKTLQISLNQKVVRSELLWDFTYVINYLEI